MEITNHNQVNHSGPVVAKVTEEKIDEGRRRFLEIINNSTKGVVLAPFAAKIVEKMLEITNQPVPKEKFTQSIFQGMAQFAGSFAFSGGTIFDSLDALRAAGQIPGNNDDEKATVAAFSLLVHLSLGGSLSIAAGAAVNEQHSHGTIIPGVITSGILNILNTSQATDQLVEKGDNAKLELEIHKAKSEGIIPPNFEAKDISKEGETGEAQISRRNFLFGKRRS